MAWFTGPYLIYVFKGIGSRDEYFLKAYKLNLYFMFKRRKFLKFVGCLDEEKNKFTDFASFYENPY